MNELENNSGKMTSLEIAELSGITHANLMKSIRKQEETWLKIGQVNFDLTSYIDKSNRAKPMYSLSKTETLYIATKFNDEARARLIIRWEALEIEKQKPLSQIDLIIQSAQRLKAIEEKEIEQDKRIRLLEAKSVTIPEYFTIAGYGTLNGVSVNIKLASRLGREASKICKDKNLLTDTTPDPRFGKVKMYPKIVLDQVFNTVPL
jgi:phage regulator Rha-like protein